MRQAAAMQLLLRAIRTSRQKPLQEHKPADKTESPPLFGDVVLDADFDALEAGIEFTRWRFPERNE